MKTKASDYAFPRPGTDFNRGYTGLTKREYFTIMLAQGMCAEGEYDDYEGIAQGSVALADRIINELNNTGESK